MGARILVVEDEQMVAAGLRGKLHRMGHAVVGLAATGPEAVRLARDLCLDLVLMDVRLQGAMDGRETARQILQAVSTRVVYVTANSDLFLRHPEDMVAPGLCVTEPFSAAHLQTIIAVALDLPPEAKREPREEF